MSKNVVVLKKLLHMREEASSFEKKYIMSMSYFHTVSISAFLSQYFFLGTCFANSAFDSTNIFQCLSQDLQVKGSYFSVLFSDRFVLRFLGPRYASLSLKIYFLKFDIFLRGCPRCNSENVPSILEKNIHLFE